MSLGGLAHRCSARTLRDLPRGRVPSSLVASMGLRFRGNVQVASPQHRDPYGTGREGDTARTERGSPPWVPERGIVEACVSLRGHVRICRCSVM
jgi:hypothetical protein